MRLASFNLENLFSRPEVMNRDSWAGGKEVLTDLSSLNTELAKATYTASGKQKIKQILDKYKFGNRNIQKRPFIIQEIRKKLFKVPQGTSEVEIVAEGRDSWVGWVDLRREQIVPKATTITGRVIHEVGADVLCTIEIEDRLTLERFNKQVLGNEFHSAFDYAMCIDGNDFRGIDVGLLSRYPIGNIRTHIYDTDGDGIVFSRDCAEFEVSMPSGESLWVLINHFKSKGYGSSASSNKKRKRQATRVAEIYREACSRSELVVVAGDLNDIPSSDPLEPLIQQTNLKDISDHSSWQGTKGTYGTGNAKSSKIDYLLLSPPLWDRITQVGIERRGINAPSLGIKWPDVTAETAASDHAAIWVDLDFG